MHDDRHRVLAALHNCAALEASSVRFTHDDCRILADELDRQTPHPDVLWDGHSMAAYGRECLKVLDEVFQVSHTIEHTILPEFLSIGQSKIEGVKKLAIAYRDLKSKHDELDSFIRRCGGREAILRAVFNGSRNDAG